ncbi:extracellular solute-binding protein [Dactylosporangium sp. CS-047395]|uniref:extracellular solute-binding protein n=1 Tax=Dactylosporangium sp. CS-047395 TaxID=3239936 RepID=UPI003D8B1210
MRARKLWRGRVAVAVGLAGVLALAACGGSDDSGANSSGEIKGTIDFWMGDPIGDAQQPIMQKLADDYAAAHPGTKVNLRFLGKDAHQTYLTSIAGGSVPCVALIGNTWTPEFAALNALDVYAADPKTMNGTYVPGMIESTIFKGKSYAVPYDTGVRALIYRKDMLEGIGKSAAPATWDELRTDALAIQAKNQGVNGFGIIGGAHWYYLPLIWNWGGEIAKQSGDKWVSEAGSAQSVQAFQFYSDLLTKDKLSPAGASAWTAADVDKSMGLGQTAMMVGGSWDLRTILKQSPDLEGKLGTAVLPKGPGGNNDTFAGGSNLAVFRECNNKAVANDFVKFAMSKENLVPITSNLGLLPATNDALAQEKASGSFSAPLFKAFADQADHTRSIPPVASWGKVEGANSIVNAMQSIMSGKKPANAAMKDLADQVNQAIG